MTRRVLVGILAAVLMVAGSLASAVEAGERRNVDREPVIREFNDDGTAAPGDEVIGRSVLRRSDRGLRASVAVSGLRPGGVYTFWWVVPQGDQVFPDDIFVAQGAGVVVGRDGVARVRMRAATGQPGIEGFPVLEGALFGRLVDPLGSLVRVEIAYHGQVEDAGDELDTWLADFWTGAACPPDTPNPNPDQPHCPVYYASTHTP